MGEECSRCVICKAVSTVGVVSNAAARLPVKRRVPNPVSSSILCMDGLCLNDRGNS